MLTSEIPSVGTEINKHALIELLADGPHSWVWLGCNRKNTTYRVFKIAKPVHLVGADPVDSYGNETRSFIAVTGSLDEIELDNNELLRHEFDFIKVAHGVGICELYGLHDWNGLLYIEMAYLPKCVTLRHLLNLGRGTLDHVSHLLFIADWCQRLRIHHGDLKPENILVRENELWLIDAGFFGNMKVASGAEEQVIYTTPDYYPWLQPNDIWAIGAILWEVVVGKHPLRFPLAENHLQIGKELETLLRCMEATGRYFLSPIRNLRLPFDHSEQSGKIQNDILLRTIGLKYERNKIELSKDAFDSLRLQEAVGVLRRITRA